MKRPFFLAATIALNALAASAQGLTVESPNGQTVVEISCTEGRPEYTVSHAGRTMIEPSALGLSANIGDFASALTVTGHSSRPIDTLYNMRGAKTSAVNYEANELTVNYENAKRQKMSITFRVANNDVAFRYSFPQQGETASMVITGEATAFRLPQKTTTFLTPQSDPMIGWKRTKPSYEEIYKPDAPLAERSQYGRGYTFPALFHIGDDGWALVSETGTNGSYVGCRLSDHDAQRGYKIEFPMEGEANGIGTTTAGMALPGATPWRTITVGATLKPIVETTAAFDVVDEQYRPTEDYRPGRYTWSWLIWQDNSVNYSDQAKFIDLAAEMGYEYTLVDGLWDKQIGREGIERLSRYARSKGVSLLLWYNSNGYENDAPQGPKHCMATSAQRHKEMAWMKSIGVRGIKVDFFGGDKQHTLQLYEDILADANQYGLQVIFHGCTLPRGWEKMYPNFVASEAVLASENVFFSETHARREAFDLTLHPFCRNAVAAMDWGGTIMNRYMSPDNKSRHRRFTSDTFEMAAAIINQSSVQCIALQPNNIAELPKHELDFLRQVPTAWDETRLIDGYPGRFVVLARRSGKQWTVAALNATDRELTLKLSLPMLADRELRYITDAKAKGEAFPASELSSKKIGRDGATTITIQPNGGAILY